MPDVGLAVHAYAQGLFPMDEPEAQHGPLPFYRADPRAVFELDPAALDALARRVRRSVARDPGWRAATDEAFTTVVSCCARPRDATDGVWLTPRLSRLYRALHGAGYAHTFELWAGETLAAGIVGVVLGRAAMLETMFHAVPHAGNVNVLRTLQRLAGAGVELCDIQIASAHTRRLGAVELPARVFDARLHAALAGGRVDVCDA